ncbi:hypothetical protein SAMN06272781_6828 [Streptomyces sp. 1222.2]|uniref:hypothetical protein n=1 Tax=Streptomyces sp. 1222.2 TaxID=1938833 RepID=UPI000BC4E82A|nr:hypothetical protein [Streptomyces sp. 1222.2]SOD80021.1 hypothetical protein SAMN06272781_6828 [Streptomyces sp. 1222.2]
MKCSEPKPGDSWRECDKNLKHPGSHRYLNESWPRRTPNAPDLDVKSLLEETLPARVWGVDERRYPIVIVETVTRVLWVDAKNEDDALAYWADDWSEIPLKEAHVLGADLEFRRLEDYERDEALRVEMGHEFGPKVQCPGCGRLSFRRAWFHDPYRKCHGPIVWKLLPGARRHIRDYQQTPAGGAVNA